MHSIPEPVVEAIEAGVEPTESEVDAIGRALDVPATFLVSDG